MYVDERGGGALLAASSESSLLLDASYWIQVTAHDVLPQTPAHVANNQIDRI